MGSWERRIYKDSETVFGKCSGFWKQYLEIIFSLCIHPVNSKLLNFDRAIIILLKHFLHGPSIGLVLKFSMMEHLQMR